MSAVFLYMLCCTPITVVHKITVVPLTGILLPPWLVHRPGHLEIGKMINHCTKAFVFGLAAVGGSVALPVTPAYAQSGSRICGYVATTSTGMIGLLYEARTEDSDYDKQCSDANTSFGTKIQQDPQLKQLTWSRYVKVTCETAGQNFVTATVNSDICEQMLQREHYKVTKTISTRSAVTVFEKQ